ncbi:MAG: M1 family metallopeptidase, partial [Chitinophagaceae bacterium]
MNGVGQQYKMQETILEVNLTSPIMPGAKTVFDMQFEAQVPLTVLRAGRDYPPTGVRYSMGQWYPKLCEYDYEGWHPTPYVIREYFGVWGDYEVNITIDKSYVLAASGYLENANEIGYGYETPGIKVNRPTGDKLTWHFLALDVHDFMWAADPHYKHLVRKTPGGTTINVFYNADQDLLKQRFDTMRPSVRTLYKNDFKTYVNSWDNQWNTIADAAITVYPFIEKNFGPYAYKQFSFIHGGNGAMEYPMATLLSVPSYTAAFHEWMHSWYQGVIGTNESEYAWMDEGFANYAEELLKRYYLQQTSVTTAAQNIGTASLRLKILDSVGFNIHEDAYESYFNIAKSGYEEPMTTHADHFNTNYAYQLAAYGKGEIFVEQLGYITGAAVRDKILLEYYRLWRFKHPNVNDFIRVAEKVSGMKLDWYREYWINTTKTINYGIDSLWVEDGKTRIRIKNLGEVPMPVDLQLRFKDGTKELHYVPMYLMFGQKQEEFPSIPRKVYEPWKWTHRTYIVETTRKITDITAIEIDPTLRLADVDRRDNVMK